MACYRPTARQSSLSRATRRAQGIVSLATLLTLTVLLGLAALAIDMALLAHQQRQLQAGCEAAALAGASMLMDRSLLPRNLQSLELPLPSDKLFAERQILLARAQAIRFAGANHVAGEKLALRDNPRNAPDGPLVVGWLAAPTNPQEKLIPWRGAGPYNALQVRYERSLSLGNAFSMRFGRWLGIASLDTQVTTIAAIDQRIYGFRPTRSSAVPLLPIMALPDGSPDAWLNQVSASVTRHSDRFGVESPSTRLLSESDGVPEVVLRLPAMATSASLTDPAREATAWLLPIGEQPTNSTLLAAQIRDGMIAADLASLGGAFALGEDNSLLLPQQRRHATDALRHVHAALLEIRGQRRIIPLGMPVVQEGATFYEVRDFAAGLVVEAVLQSDGMLQITLQPTLMQTPTALVRDGQPRNAWLGKLVVTE